MGKGYVKMLRHDLKKKKLQNSYPNVNSCYLYKMRSQEIWFLSFSALIATSSNFSTANM